MNEFEALYRLGWRGQLFLVDDNFISNKRDALKLLPVLAEWQKARGYPFTLFTEATVNLARMDELMDVMIEAGFNAVYVGIETPQPQGVAQDEKTSEREEAGRAVSPQFGSPHPAQGDASHGGDSSWAWMMTTKSAFDAQIDFIQEAGIPLASVGLLTAIKGTDLYKRLKRENRLLDQSVGARTDSVVNLISVNIPLNFIPEMDPVKLAEGYRRVITTLYDPTLENYFKRCLTLLAHLKAVPHLLKPQSRNALFGAMMAIRRRLSPRQVPAYQQFMARVSKDHPRMLPEATSLAVQGVPL